MAKKTSKKSKTDEQVQEPLLIVTEGKPLPVVPGEVPHDPVEQKLDTLIALVMEMSKKIPFQGLDMSKYRFKD